MIGKANGGNSGVITSVRGSVVDVRFDPHLPPIYSVLRAGAKDEIVIEVLAQSDAHHVRGIALTPRQGLAIRRRWNGGPRGRKFSRPGSK